MIWSNGACFVVNSQFAIEHWNDSLSQFTGMTESEVLHRPCHEVFAAQLFTGMDFCQKSCPLVTEAGHTADQPMFVIMPTRYMGQQLVQIHFAIWDDPLTIIHWIQPVNRDFKPANPLTPRQQQIFTLLAQGLTRREIAQHLNISLSTVNTHIRRVCEMWEAPTERHALTRFMRMQGSNPDNSFPSSSS
ncbi:helix-turn-helix transcriptional regulator [Sulfobacillus thermosulfidooxidans]|uniref:helix-turn-helix transcriptional regulator n=1 Tax=Sulfobacillus thermosulfidooxidans TaxID=28034 RepID=UPI000414D40F|nr:PAS and helix-turn-helix domain-containing protein [Sulfobacillus thermosulfidooxidans]